jgi:hypothetical protein
MTTEVKAAETKTKAERLKEKTVLGDKVKAW